MKSQVLHTVWHSISGEAAGEIWHWSLSGVKGLIQSENYNKHSALPFLVNVILDQKNICVVS